MGQTDIQFKDSLRKELIMLKHFKELAENDKKEELLKSLDEQITRVTESLQD